ncbi:MAG: electron transfer flavoprotein subunit beta/FixA family protein [Candidatus Methanomethylophilaceae archaeon]|nr:electron transfer flavoprotein subunit beta/FixA family protein [Candidatus Methanomethylophilaceae archaeon]
MRFLVAVKQVPDTSAMRVDADGNLVRQGVPSILDPYCETALCRILDTRVPGDEVAVFTMGPPQAESCLRRCLDLGADRAFLITDRDLGGSDTWATARAVSAFVERHCPDADLLVFGRQTIDGGTGQVPYEVAQLLDRQQFAYVTDLSIGDGGIEATQDYGDSLRRCKVPVRSVVSFGEVDLKGRLCSIADHIRAGERSVVKIDRVGLGLGVYSVGLKGSTTRIEGTSVVKGERKCRKVRIENPDRAVELIFDMVGVKG